MNVLRFLNLAGGDSDLRVCPPGDLESRDWTPFFAGTFNAINFSRRKPANPPHIPPIHLFGGTAFALFRLQ